MNLNTKGERMKLKEAEQFNKDCRYAIESETYDEFLEQNGFADAWEALEHLLNLLYGDDVKGKEPTIIMRTFLC